MKGKNRSSYRELQVSKMFGRESIRNSLAKVMCHTSSRIHTHTETPTHRPADTQAQPQTDRHIHTKTKLCRTNFY